jgi:hypothetical protein
MFTGALYSMSTPPTEFTKEVAPKGTGQDGAWPPTSIGGSDIDPNETFDELGEKKPSQRRLLRLKKTNSCKDLFTLFKIASLTK